MRIILEIVGIVLVINGIGGLFRDDFGLLAHVANGGAPGWLPVAAIVAGVVLGGGSLMSRTSS